MRRPRPHLACLTTSAALGGAETSVLTLLTALARLEPSWRITVILPADGPLGHRCRAAGFDVVRLPFPPGLAGLGESAAVGAARRSIYQGRLVAGAMRAAAGLPGYLRQLASVLDSRAVTVLHTNGLKAHVAGALARPAGTRLVWHLHEYVRARPLTARLLRALAHRTECVVANSESVRRDAEAAFGPSVACRRIYNAVDLDAFTPEGAVLDLAALAGGPGDGAAVRVGLVATFGRWKGHDVFIDALARLSARETWRAYVVGGAVYETPGSQWQASELRARADAAGVNGALRFTGHVEDVPAAMRALDVVVHASSKPEPFGMVIAEAMACGRAVVAVRAGGAAEIFEDGRTAVGFEQGDAAGLAACLGALVEDRVRREALGAAARAAACRQFAPDRMAAEFREAYGA